MHFRRQGKRIQVVAYRGYDREKRRPITKILGTIDAESCEPTAELLEQLSSKEREELFEFKDGLEKERLLERRLELLKGAPRQLEEMAQSLSAVLNEAVALEALDGAWGADLWRAIESVSKSLRKSGFAKPERVVAERRPPPQNFRDRHLFPGYDLASPE